MNRLNAYISEETIKNSVIEEKENLLIVKYNSRMCENIRPVLLMFKGKSRKPLHWVYTQDEEARAAIIDKEVQKVQKAKENKLLAAEKNKEKRLNAINNVEIGDVFYSSWGYEQTNVEFYQVIGKSGQTLELVEIAQKRTEEGYMYGFTAPVLNSVIGEPFKKRVNTYGNIKFNSFKTAAKLKIERVGSAINIPPLYWSSYA